MAQPVFISVREGRVKRSFASTIKDRMKEYSKDSNKCHDFIDDVDRLSISRSCSGGKSRRNGRWK
jgi:hypothetical protein